jgi:nicotinamidase-related amidase
MLTPEQTVLVIVDVQGKLAQLMFNRDALFDNLRRMAEGARALNLPVLWTEQNPRGMGPTIAELSPLIGGDGAIPKMAFGCCGEPAFMTRLEETGRRQVLLAGIETHVCMFQTAAQLTERGYAVHVAGDAVSSRSEANYRIGLERMRRAGAEITSVESALFEIMGTADHPAFRDVLKIVR